MLTIERVEFCENKAQEVFRVIPDCIDLAMVIESILRHDNDVMSEEEIDKIYDIVSKGFREYKLPKQLRQQVWNCPVCKSVKVIFGKTCPSCRKEGIPKVGDNVTSIGIAEIANLDEKES